MPYITFVKKILSDGSLCKKCQEVSERLESDGLLAVINHIVIADERDAKSNGMQLANKHNVSRAPFFLLEEDNGEIEVFDIYFKFKRHLAQLGFGRIKAAEL